MMTASRLKVSPLSKTHLDFVAELELADKLYYDEDIELNIVRFYSWDKTKFSKVLNQDNVRGFIISEPSDGLAAPKIKGFIIFTLDKEEGNINILNLVGVDNESLEELTKHIINMARFNKKPYSVTYYVRDHNKRALEIWKAFTKEEKISPKLVTDYFKDCDAILYYLPFSNPKKKKG